MKKKDIFFNYYDNIFYQGDIIVMICRAERKKKNWIEHSAKLDYDLWIMTEGTVHIKTMSKSIVLNKGDVYLFYPNIEYEASCMSDGCAFIYAHFDFKIGYNNRALDCYDINTNYEYSEVKAQVDPFFDFFKKSENDQLISFLAVKGSFLSLLAKIIEIKGRKPVQTNTNPKSIIKLIPALDYISSHLDSTINLKTLSDIVFLSEKYFCSLFKDIMGISPIKYINDLKINTSLEYLYENKYSIKEISELLGYSDQFAFSTAFRTSAVRSAASCPIPGAPAEAGRHANRTRTASSVDNPL